MVKDNKKEKGKNKKEKKRKGEKRKKEEVCGGDSSFLMGLRRGGLVIFQVSGLFSLSLFHRCVGGLTTTPECDIPVPGIPVPGNSSIF